jgi:triose/dihydroxyacetone kinase / FAD-AMP lyase (cyclizing)
VSERHHVPHSSSPITHKYTRSGTSGVLLEILLTAAARSIAAGASFGEALEAGVDAIEFYGGARPGSRTMIDALRPAAAAWKAGKALSDVAAAAREGADATKAMTASAGRANWVGKDNYEGVPDPGAAAVAVVLEAAAKAAA